MTLVERQTRCILGWRVVTERTDTVTQALIDETPDALQYCTDGFSLYAGRDYHRGYHLVAPGKSETYAVEADNAELRHYIKCLARSTRCFAKQLDSLIRRIKLFVHCWNQRQLHRRAFPKYGRPLFTFASFLF
jgi:IS1 family transposase